MMRFPGLLTALLALFLYPAISWSDESPPLRIGRVVDGPSVTIDEFDAMTLREIEILTHGEMDLRFEPRHRLSADWTLDGADRALQRLLDDPEVDLVLAIGLLSSQRVCCLGPLPKPVVAATVLDAEFQGLPRSGLSSGVHNLAYVDLPDGTYDELADFYDVVPFKRLVMLASREIIEGLPDLITAAREEIGGTGIEPHFVGVSTSAEEGLASLDAIPDVDAVYVWPLYRLTPDEFSILVDGLIERRLPTFSALGGREVKAGLMATRRGDGLLNRVARRVAIDVQRILLGEEAGEIPVEITARPRLTLNMKTARAVGLQPRWETLLEARLIEEAPSEDLEKLDLTTMVSRVVAANLDLAVQRSSVRADEQDIAVARSAFQPRVESSLLGVQIDDDRAEASFGQQAERTLTASLGISQLIYSDGASANLGIQRLAHDARLAGYDSLSLDIAFQAGVTYLNLLRAETLQRVRRNNLELTRSNLDVAELRVEVGAATPSEIYRWQSQIAGDRQELITAAADVQTARLAVNRLMHRELETAFSTVEVGLTPEFLIDPDRIESFIATPERFKMARDFAVAEALERSPDLRSLRASLAAQERRLLATRRAFWRPTVAAQFSLDHRLETGGVGSDLPATPGPSADDTNWSLGLSGSLDLWTGGERRAEELRAEEEVKRLTLQIDSVGEQVSESLRAAMVQTRASFLGIALARQSAEAAERSQSLVADAYARGTLSILDLLDAQNAALNADLAAANAVYDFFIDLLSLERAGNRFYMLADPEEREAWVDRLEIFFSERGLGPWKKGPFATPDAASENQPHDGGEK